MATTRSFQDMLNEYLTYDLLKEELVKRDYVLNRVEKDDGWKGGTIPVPFKAAGASSLKFGGLTASNDVSEDANVRGEVTGYKELWGTMKFNHRDLVEHDGKVSEKSFLKILPDAIEDFMDYMKQMTSITLLKGNYFAKLTSASTAAGGAMVVDRPDMFNIGQKVTVENAAVDLYVTAININTRTLTMSSSRGGAAYDFSADNVASASKVYVPGADTAANAFTSLKAALLSAANGGDATLYGQTKTAYPYLQSINVDGSSVTSSNILSKLFDGYVTVRTFGKGNPNECIMSYRNFGYVLSALESSKGSFNVVPGSQKTSVYGWTEISIGGVKGELKIIGVQEMDDAAIIFMDWRAAKFHSNGFFRKRIAPDGKHYYEERATTGYTYLVDLFLFGELIVSRPSYCGIMHSIP
jgi:hypothetical protein